MVEIRAICPVPDVPEAALAIEKQYSNLTASARHSGKVTFNRLWRTGKPDRLILRNIPNNQEKIIDGVVWPGSMVGLVWFDNLFGFTEQAFILPSSVTAEAWHKFSINLLKRNFHNRAPLFPFNCPNCNLRFTPKRRGQFYCSHRCAATATQRVRRKNTREAQA